MTLNSNVFHCYIKRSELSQMKVREGFVKNAGNLNSGVASARSLAVRTGETANARLVSNWSIHAAERKNELTSTW